MKNWISIKDKLPKDGLWVIYVTDKKGIAVGFYEKDDNIWECVIELMPIGNVTHWMPLPEPPEE